MRAQRRLWCLWQANPLLDKLEICCVSDKSSNSAGDFCSCAGFRTPAMTTLRALRRPASEKRARNRGM